MLTPLLSLGYLIYLRCCRSACAQRSSVGGDTAAELSALQKRTLENNSPPIWQVSHHGGAYHQKANPSKSKSYPVRRRHVKTQQTNPCTTDRLERVTMKVDITKTTPKTIRSPRIQVRVSSRNERQGIHRYHFNSKLRVGYGYGSEQTLSPTASGSQKDGKACCWLLCPQAPAVLLSLPFPLAPHPGKSRASLWSNRK